MFCLYLLSLKKVFGSISLCEKTQLVLFTCCAHFSTQCDIEREGASLIVGIPLGTWSSIQARVALLTLDQILYFLPISLDICNTFWTKFENSCPNFYATSSLDYEKVLNSESLFVQLLIRTKKIIHKNAYILGFLFAISPEKSLKLLFSLIVMYLFFMPTKQWFRTLTSTIE